ncbi:MAG: PrsW family intramembrane metalloprotease [Bacteroidota bacterium]
MQYVVSLLPVTIFLFGLYLFDSFKLVRKTLLLICLLWGAVSAGFAFYINTAVSGGLVFEFDYFSRYVSPLTEELLKALILFFLVSRRKIGFMVDGLVYGFAVGTGFALAENMFYLWDLNAHGNIAIWIIRGFGTALMHGGATALFSTMIMAGIQRNKSFIVSVWPGLLMAYGVHSLFNHFLVSPLLQTFLLLLLLPVIFTLVFRRSNTLMQDWLEIEFSSEVEMLSMIRKGRFRDTKAGAYLTSLKDYFEPETIVDLYAYIRLYLELSIVSKRNLLLKENGYDVIMEEETQQNLRELKQLRRMIGKAGELAIQPVVRMSYRELWKLNQLG